MAPGAGFEPATNGLTVRGSTTELTRNNVNLKIHVSVSTHQELQFVL
jgi:hypothetical protein